MTRLTYLLVFLALPIAALAQPGPFVEDTTSPLTASSIPSLSPVWGDYDNDGDLDLLVTNNISGPDELYRNEGNGAFTLLPFVTDETSSTTTTSGIWADFDNDGDLDLVTSSLNDGSFFLNQGSEDGVPRFRYKRIPIDDFREQRDIVVADYNGDGLLDGVVVRGRLAVPSILIQNMGSNGVVVDSEVSANTFDSTSGCTGDVNNDGRADLYLTGTIGAPNEFFFNLRGSLIDVADPNATGNLGRTQSCSWGDFDNDGDLDLIINNFDSADDLFRNDGQMATVVDGLGGDERGSRASVWGDVDNDGDLDLVSVRDDASNTLYLNDGTGQFTGIDFGGASNSELPSVTLTDDDGDGDLDIFIANGAFFGFHPNQLYRNTTTGNANRLSSDAGSANNWLEVDLRRPSGGNRFGVGALVFAYATIDGQSRTLLRSVETRAGRNAQSGNRLHFGLGDAATVDSLVIRWPVGVNDEPTVLTNVAVNQILTVTGDEDEVTSPPITASTAQTEAFAIESVYPNPSAGAMTIAVRSGAEAPMLVEVFDVMGRRVKTLEAAASTGAVIEFSWDGADEAGRSLAGGVYVVRVRQGAEQQITKLTLLR